MQTLKFLGRSSALNRIDGSTSAYIEKSNRLLLIDCGESICDKISDLGLVDKGTEEVNILITHGHGDHTGSLSTFIFECFYKFNIIPNVYYPEMERIRDYLLFSGNVKDVHYKLYDSSCCNLLNMDIKVTAKEVEHVSIYRNIETGVDIYEKPPKGCEDKYISMFKSYAYYIEVDEKNIYYSGDSGEFNVDLDIVDEVYHDCSSYDIEGFPHIGLNSLADKVDEKYRQKVFLMHFDNDELISKAKSLGFEVVDIEGQKVDCFYFPRKTIKVKGVKIKSHGRRKDDIVIS